ncbi:MAG: hypothetical protein JW910_00220, partial [Anaerolineae bacterium]|nr:hypothetical protein [Anaerolineae bacterium]
WFALAVIIIGVSALATNAFFALQGMNLVIVFGILAASAGLATMRLWTPGAASTSAAAREAAPERRKTKRVQRERLANLLDRLDEDEAVELETLLMARDEDVI